MLTISAPLASPRKDGLSDGLFLLLCNMNCFFRKTLENLTICTEVHCDSWKRMVE